MKVKYLIFAIALTAGVFSYSEAKAWPDIDLEAVNDMVDQFEASIADTDDDGIRDVEDDCPDIVGPDFLQGCPYATTVDGDRDGILNWEDACPSTGGQAEFEGCADSESLATATDGNDDTSGADDPVVDDDPVADATVIGDGSAAEPSDSPGGTAPPPLPPDATEEPFSTDFDDQEQAPPPAPGSEFLDQSGCSLLGGAESSFGGLVLSVMFALTLLPIAIRRK